MSEECVRILDPASCMDQTYYIDKFHPSILATLKHILDPLTIFTKQERAVQIFSFVQNHITYAFRAQPNRDDYKASSILQHGEGFCVQKAILLAALGRAAQIPTAIAICDLVDATLPTYISEKMGGTTLYHHGINAFYLQNRWILADASLSPNVVKKKQYRPIIFDGTKDALHAKTTLTGAPHATYLAWRGLFSDFNFETLMHTFHEEYPRTDIANMNSLVF